MIVGSGLYVLRYVSTRDEAQCPTVSVAPSEGHGASITLMPAPGHLGHQMSAPGDCLLVRAETPGALEVTVTAVRSNGSLEAEVRLERIASSEASASKANSPQPHSPAQPITQLLSHISRRGDIVCEQGEWAGNSDDDTPIEGFEIRWNNKPAGVELHYTVTAGTNERQRLQEKVAGQFAGTRGKAMPLVGVTCALSGPRAGDYEIRADAIFAGGEAISKSGTEISLSSPSGREPLVGLRFSINATRNDIDVVRPSDRRDAVVMKQVGRVRVYRPGPLHPVRAREGVNRSVRV